MKLVVHDNSTQVIEVLSDEDAKVVIPNYEQKIHPFEGKTIKKQAKMKVHNVVEIVPQFYQGDPLPPLPPLHPDMNSESFMTQKTPKNIVTQATSILLETKNIEAVL